MEFRRLLELKHVVLNQKQRTWKYQYALIVKSTYVWFQQYLKQMIVEQNCWPMAQGDLDTWLGDIK